jgi:Uma2 family endonuclease
MSTWKEICDDPRFQDLPYKMETDKYGRIILTPSKTIHGRYQFQIGHELSILLPQGYVITECPIETSDGTKVADVAWLTAEHDGVARHQVACTQAPAICVEVKSAKNTWKELADKRQLYFDRGAQEVWICKDGVMQFFDLSGELSASKMAPDFPKNILLT